MLPSIQRTNESNFGIFIFKFDTLTIIVWDVLPLPWSFYDVRESLLRSSLLLRNESGKSDLLNALITYAGPSWQPTNPSDLPQTISNVLCLPLDLVIGCSLVLCNGYLILKGLSIGRKEILWGYWESFISVQWTASYVLSWRALFRSLPVSHECSMEAAILIQSYLHWIESSLSYGRPPYVS